MHSGIFNILSLICNLAIVVFMAKSLFGFYTVGGAGNMRVKKSSAFIYFTVQSNFFMALASCAMLVFNVLAIIRGSAPVPYALTAVKFSATAAVTLTLCVVMFLFVPITGLKEMIEGDSFFMHLVSPVLAILSFVLFEGGSRLTWPALGFAFIPVAAYGVLYYIMVVTVGEEKGGWKDFYGFNKGGKWYVSAIGVFLMAAVIALLLRFGHNYLACSFGG